MSSLGDVIHNCPAVSDIRVRFPEAAIDWVVEEPFAGIVSMHPGVRRVIPVAVRRWRKRLHRWSTWGEVLAFRRSLREEAYDAVIDTQGLLKSALICASAVGPSHGLDASSAREPLASRFYDERHRISRELHAVERNRRLAAMALSVEPAHRCDYGLVPAGSNPLALQRPFCVLLSMTSRAGKLWPEENWAMLVRGIASSGFESVLPWGTADEQARCNRIVAVAGAGLVPKWMNLGDIAAVMKQSSAAVGVDTGLAHLAVALGVPAVGLYCASQPALTGLHGDSPCINLGGVGHVPSVESVLQALRGVI